MKKTARLDYTYTMAVIYRFILAFIVGFVATALLSVALTFILNLVQPKAESIYLAGFLSILFYVFFVIFSFCIHSLVKLSLFSGLVCLFFYLIIVGVA